MKNIVIITSFLCFFTTITIHAQKDIEGVWYTETKDAKIEIYKIGNYYYGKAIWFNEDKYKDKIGFLVLEKFTQRDHVFSGGTVFDPRHSHDLKASGTLILQADGSKLAVKAKILHFFNQSETWTKTNK